MPQLSIIIVSYNTREMTLDCLRALHADLTHIDAEVFVVDNASQDNSVEAIQSAFPQTKIIANQNNRGFGAANNLAFAQATAPYILLLNSDAFPKPGAIPALIAYLNNHPRAAIVGPRLLNADGSLQISCYKFPSPFRAWVENLWLSSALASHPTIGDYRKWNHDSERDVDWIIGACLLVRREVIQQVGGFDEKFFMYAEESDWQRRIRNAGWTIAFSPAATVTHLGGASGNADKPKINRIFFQSLDYYERKHHGLPGLVALRLAMILGCSIRTLAWTFVLLVRPKKRPQAAAKIKLLSWLVLRQTTHWNVPA